MGLPLDLHLVLELHIQVENGVDIYITQVATLTGK